MTNDIEVEEDIIKYAMEGERFPQDAHHHNISCIMPHHRRHDDVHRHLAWKILDLVWLWLWCGCGEEDLLGSLCIGGQARKDKAGKQKQKIRRERLRYGGKIQRYGGKDEIWRTYRVRTYGMAACASILASCCFALFGNSIILAQHAP